MLLVTCWSFSTYKSYKRSQWSKAEPMKPQAKHTPARMSCVLNTHLHCSEASPAQPCGSTPDRSPPSGGVVLGGFGGHLTAWRAQWERGGFWRRGERVKALLRMGWILGEIPRRGRVTVSRSNATVSQSPNHPKYKGCCSFSKKCQHLRNHHLHGDCELFE